jgi:hypothetical protein
MYIFVSYSSVDRPLARKVAEVFRARGSRVWIDEGELGPGDFLASSLAKALGEVDAYVAILTRNSANSNWVKSELNSAVTRMVNDGISVIPLRFDDSPIPEVVAGLVWGDGRTEEGLARALNSAHLGVTVPMEPAQILDRYKRRLLLSYGIRLIPTASIKTSRLLGAPERKYVVIGDYAEQCGRSLRQIQANLWFGDAFDRVASAKIDWSAVIFEVGETQRKKLDLLPGTWKAVFRILSSPRRLAMIQATEDEQRELGPRPHDYYMGDQDYWYNRIMDRRFPGIGPTKVSPEKVLEDQFGIYDLCFIGDGITRTLGSTAIPSRVFLVKNAPLETLNIREQALGQPNDGVLLV